MLAITLKPELEKLLIEAVERSGVSLDSLVGEAIERMLEEEQDIELLKDALKTYDPSQNISMEQLRRELGLDT